MAFFSFANCPVGDSLVLFTQVFKERGPDLDSCDPIYNMMVESQFTLQSSLNAVLMSSAAPTLTHISLVFVSESLSSPFESFFSLPVFLETCDFQCSLFYTW